MDIRSPTLSQMSHPGAPARAELAALSLHTGPLTPGGGRLPWGPNLPDFIFPSPGWVSSPSSLTEVL